MNIEKSVFEPAQRLVSYFGSREETQKVMGVSQATVSNWINKTHGINAINAQKAERLTKGAIKASELCPALIEVEDIG